ncbi:hypothetical protein Fmac_011153 [Flemingia macrophylla]|uniref:RNA helicase n=1 Tax=Flemingia macrophylla TaxID=520843 RepID=A0ABD1MMF1_9FABA
MVMRATIHHRFLLHFHPILNHCNLGSVSLLQNLEQAVRVEVEAKIYVKIPDILVSLEPRSKPQIAYSYLLSYTLQRSHPFPLALTVLQWTLHSCCFPVPLTHVLLSSAWLNRQDLFHSVANILLQMQSIGYHPDCGTCNNLQSALCAVDQLLEAVKVLRGMGRAGCIPDSNSYGTVIGAMCRVRKTVEAQDLMKQMVVQYGVTPGQGTLVKLLAALRANGEIWKAVEMIEFLEKEGNSVGFELVVEGCLEKWEYVLTAKIATGMTERGFLPYIKVREKNIEGLASIDEWKIACAYGVTVLNDIRVWTLSFFDEFTQEDMFVISKLTDCRASHIPYGDSKLTRLLSLNSVVRDISLSNVGKDVIGLAQTGSGKTGAFALPILHALLEAPRPKDFFACVLSPTRELAIQIAEQFEALGSEIGVQCAVLVGGIDMVQQSIKIAKQPHIIVGTPGRVLDHLKNTRGFSLNRLKYLVLDEADRLLNEDFEESLNEILRLIPRDRRTFLFSATMTKKNADTWFSWLLTSSSKFMLLNANRPSCTLAVAGSEAPKSLFEESCEGTTIEAASKYSTVDTLKQQYRFLPARHKDCYLVYILTEMAGSTSMVFTRTCDATRLLALILRNLGLKAIPINGHMSQSKRLGALNKFKSGECNILLCTDVAGRGLDIPAVDMVINYDIPTNSKDYIHRVGRTARAGRSGVAISLVNQYELEWYVQIEKLIGKKLPEYPAQEEEVLLLEERVSEAKRLAVMKMKESGGKKRRRGEEDNDGEDIDKSFGLKNGKSSKKFRR